MNWQTRDGSIVPIETMSDAHLANAIAWAKKTLSAAMRVRNTAASLESRAVGHGASRAAEQLGAECDSDVHYLTRKLTALEAEQRRRKSPDKP